MTFWGVEVKPTRPVTHKYDQERGRLHISQASLGLGSASNKSVVQCNIGNKSPVILCVLLPDKTESCLLDLEFEEADDVVFSVIGPRSVYLTGYYSDRLHVNPNDSSESYGIDIVNSDSEHSSHGSDEDSYEDSFINDDDLDDFSSDIGDKKISSKKKRKRKVSGKRLKKRNYKSVVSEDESGSKMCNWISVPESDEEDCVPISTLRSKITEAEEKISEKTAEKNIENGVSHLLNEDNNILLDDNKKEDIDSQLKTPEGVLEDCAPISISMEIKTTQAQGILEKEISKIVDKEIENGGPHLPTHDKHVEDDDIDTQNTVMLDEKTLHLEEKTVEKSEEDRTCGDSLLMESKTTKSEEKMEMDIISKTDDNEIENGGSHLEIPDNSINDNKQDDIDNLAFNASKSKKKRTERTEETPEANYGKIETTVTKEDKTEEKALVTTDREANQSCNDQLISTKSDKENSLRLKKRRKKSDRGFQNGCINEKDHDLALNQAVDEDLLKDNKISRKKKKKNKTQDKEITGVSHLSETNKKIGGSHDDKNIESKVRTLSNGLIIEDIDLGKPDGKVATSGKKIKVNYVGKLRDGGHLIDSNIGKSPLKLRLGGEGVTESWNIGLDGMRVGGKRRLTIPPTNGGGRRGEAGEMVAPHAWLVYDFELVKVR